MAPHPAQHHRRRRIFVRAHQLAGEKATQILGQLVRRRIARRRCFGHRARHDGDELARRAARQPGVAARLRRAAGQQALQHAAERVDIGALVDGLAARLLRRHEVGRADDGAGARDVIGRRRRRRRRRRCDAGLVAADRLGDAPIDHQRLAEAGDHDVRRLQIAMDDAVAMRIGHRIRRGEHVRHQRQPLLQRRRVEDQLLERAARDQLHRVERLARGQPSRLVDGHDRRMLQPRRDRRLAQEARLEDALPRHARRVAIGRVLDGAPQRIGRRRRRRLVVADHHLERHVAAHLLVGGAKDLAHASGAERLLDHQRRGGGDDLLLLLGRLFHASGADSITGRPRRRRRLRRWSRSPWRAAGPAAVARRR